MLKFNVTTDLNRAVFWIATVNTRARGIQSITAWGHTRFQKACWTWIRGLLVFGTRELWGYPKERSSCRICYGIFAVWTVISTQWLELTTLVGIGLGRRNDKALEGQEYSIETLISKQVYRTTTETRAVRLQLEDRGNRPYLVVNTEQKFIQSWSIVTT